MSTDPTRGRSAQACLTEPSSPFTERAILEKDACLPSTSLVQSIAHLVQKTSLEAGALRNAELAQGIEQKTPGFRKYEVLKYPVLLFTSPLVRARQTANSARQACCNAGVPSQIRELVREVDTSRQDVPSCNHLAGWKFGRPMIHARHALGSGSGNQPARTARSPAKAKQRAVLNAPVQWGTGE